MVKENWSLNHDNSNNNNNNEIDTKKTSSVTSATSNNVSSVNPIQQTSVATTNVWGEYVSKSNLIDLHFC